jgi:hypothetical protein
MLGYLVIAALLIEFGIFGLRSQVEGLRLIERPGGE